MSTKLEDIRKEKRYVFGQDANRFLRSLSEGAFRTIKQVITRPEGR